ncbi:MAG: glycosyltransferase [Bacteroides sp.]|nr:glycosyltransferase [Bacteroides sp.]
MKKKIFFLLLSMDIGGVEKSFLGLLTTIPQSKYEIHLGLIHKKGKLLKLLPSYIQIHKIDCYDKYWRLINDPPLLSIKNFFKKGNILEGTILFILYFYCKIINNRYYFYKWLLKNESIFHEKFDIAIAFAGPSQAIDYYICEKIKAPIKCGWIHFDVTKFGIDKGMTNQLYKKYRKIFIVSETAKQKFDNLFPKLKEKTEVFYNIVNPQQIKELAEIGPTFDDNFQGKRILTVGRLSAEKGQNIAIQALKNIIEKGFDVKWYFIGDGKLKEECKALAKQLGISDKVVFLGTQTNPYGFMKDCNIYMQPSRHEGFCITLAEALCFNNPIVATNFTGAKEQLSSRRNGIVTDMSASDITDGIISALDMPTITPTNCNTQTDIDKLLSLMTIE